MIPENGSEESNGSLEARGLRVVVGGPREGTPLKLRELATHLESVGLDEEEGLVYVRLLQSGPSKVSELTSWVDVSRSKLYRILDSLAERGVVEKGLDRPTVYAAADPEDVFELGLDEVDRRRACIERARDRALDRLERLSSDRDHRAEEEHWRRLEGNTPIFRALARTIEEAEEEVWALSNNDECWTTARPSVAEAWEAIADRAENGLDVRLLVEPPGPPEETLPDPVLEGDVDVRTFEDPRTMHVLVADRRDLVLSLRPDPRNGGQHREPVAVATNAPGLVATHVALFEERWQDAEPVKGTDG